MSEPTRDRWLSIGMSVLLHGTLIALLAIGIWHFHHPTPPKTLSIDATVVDARTLKGEGVAPTPTPTPKVTPPQTVPPPPAQPAQGPPLPTPAEQAMRDQAAREEAQHEAAAQQELLAREQAKQAQEEAAAKAAVKLAAAKKAAQAEKRAEAKKQAEARKKAEAAKLAKEKKLAQERKLAEEKKLAEQKKLAAQRAAAARAARIAELQQSIQEDEQAAAASGALASWTSEIKSRIQDAWIKPPTAKPGLKCVLNVSLVPGGAVTGVSLGQCNGDDAVRQSIQTAVYNASPLPPPPNNIAFPHQLIITFEPTN
ncbi:MAG TPA: cell envelope integrity protein TolA [Steroidobacteraceae bacterium]|nr:cell envelope integrity protein TolA [Steroidobacteraceae bacterium]